MFNSDYLMNSRTEVYAQLVSPVNNAGIEFVLRIHIFYTAVMNETRRIVIDCVREANHKLIVPFRKVVGIEN